MQKFKKFMAVVIAVTMVVGSSITVFADDPTSGGTDGAGASEGHVDKEVIKVVLPTVAAGSTPFAYTMDPERLIQETSAAKYAAGTVFPDKDGDTGVYFLTAANTYSNTSNTLQAINKSSTAITLTVKVKTTQGSAKDIALATSSTVATADTPDLYLGLKVGDTTTVVKAEEQTVTKTIAGVADNFEVAVKEVDGAKSYVYQEKANASTWKAMNISMEGAVSNLAIASDTTAPTVNVTWSYEKAAADATLATDAVNYSANAAPSIATKTYNLTADTAVNVQVSLGGGSLAATSVTDLKNGAQSLPSNAWSYADGVLTITADRVNSLVNAGVTRTYTVVFNDTAGTTVDIVLNGSGQ